MQKSFRKAFLLFLMVLVSVTVQAHQGSGTKIVYKVVSKKIAPGAVYKISSSMKRGQLVKESSGRAGLNKKTFRVVFKNGKVVSRSLFKEEKIRALDAMYLMGKSEILMSRHQFSRGRAIEMVATAYDPGPAANGWRNAGRSATGRRLGFGCIAVDPRVIPLGTRLYVEGYGYGIACDTGSAIKGHRIDLCFNSNDAANEFGRRRVVVHVLEER